MKAGVLTAMLAAIGITTYRSTKQTSQGPLGKLPLPSQYASIFLVYGGLGLLPGEAQVVAGAVGWGLVLAMALNLWNPVTGKVAQTATAPAPAATKKG